MVDIAVRVPAGTGAVLRSVIADSPSVTVYSNAGLSTPVTLPYTLPTSGSVTLYLGEVGRFRATITNTAGSKVLTVADGNANGATPLVFTVYAGADAPTAAGATDTGSYAAGLATTKPASPILGQPWTVANERYGLVSPQVQDRTTILTNTLGWEGAFLQEASPYFDAIIGKWCMVYTGSHGTEKLGFAVADSITGPWTKDANPFLGGGNGGEAGAIAHTSVYVEGSTVYLTYPASASNPGGAVKYVSWPLGQHPAGNMTAPATLFTPSGAASLGAANTCLFKDDDGTYVLMFEYWTTNANGLWNIGYATAPTLTGTYTQQAAPISTLRRAQGAMYGGPRLSKADGVYTVLYHACSVPAPTTGGPNILPTDVFRATATSLSGTWTQDSVPLVYRAAPAEKDQVADVRFVTDPRTGQSWVTFSQIDNVYGVTGSIAAVPVSPTLMTYDGSGFRKMAPAVPVPQARSGLLGYLNWLAGSDTSMVTTSTSYAQVNANANLCSVTFVVPPSQVVQITAEFMALVGQATSLYVNLRESGSDITGTGKRVIYDGNVATTQQRCTVTWIIPVSGPGTTKTISLGFARKDGTGQAEIQVGPTMGPLYMIARD